MANRMKEDEKNEKIIRGLLKLPGNRRCINCNSLGPQYVCTNFWTFVCTTCSGIHREFTHRVKSVSMAKFTSQEVACLKNDGGNERAKEIYLKDWDQQRNSFPDNSNVDRLRDFIKHVYEDRRYTGERGSDRPPRVKMADREDSYKQHSAPQSPPSEDTYERNNGERSRLGGRSEDRNFRYNYDGRSPGYDQDKQRYGDYKRSPAQFEGGDDKSGSRRSEDNKFLGGEPKLEGRSPSYQKELGSFSPPVVRPVRDILGENIPPLRVGEPPKVNGGKSPGGSLQTKRTSSSSNMRPIDGNPVEFKSTNLGSLIDFTSNPEPPNAATAAATATQTRQSAASTVQAFTPPINSTFGSENWASFDSLVQEKGSQVSSNANTLDSVVSQLSVPAPSPSGNITFPTSGTVLIASVESMSKLSLGSVGVTTPVNMSILPPGGSAAATAAAPASNLSSMAISGGNSFISFNDVQQGSRVQQPQHSLFPINGNQITAQPTDVSVGGGSNNQTWSSSFVSNVQGSMSNPTLPSSQFSPKLIQDTSSGEVSKAPLESRSGGRNALPEDLFTATYASVPGWQAVPPHGMGFGMQYPIAMLQHAPTFLQTSRSINPFDVNSEAALVQAPIAGQAPMFPSMAPLQGAIPNAAPTSLLRTSSLGTPMHPQWVPSQTQVYTSSIPPQPLHYVSGMPQSMYIGQQMHNNLSHSGHQAVGGFGKNGVAFGPSNTNQQLSGRSSAPATPSSYSSFSGNPFG